MHRFWVRVTSLVSLLGLPCFSFAPTYKVYLSQNPIIIDGNLDEWEAPYFFDSLENDNNVVIRSTDTVWTPKKFNARLYLAHDDSALFIGVALTRNINQFPDDSIFKDNLIINPGGDDNGAQIWSDTAKPISLRSKSIFTPDTNFVFAVGLSQNDNLPIYEAKVTISDLDPWSQGSFYLFVGFDAYDSIAGSLAQIKLGFGICNQGDKKRWNDNRDIEDPVFFPKLEIIDKVPPVTVESHKTLQQQPLFMSFPNPINGNAVLRC